MDLIGIIFVLYLLLLLGVGVWTYRFNKTQEDYLLAGRKLGPWVTAFSERASGESAWLLLALPGAAIAVGLGEAWTVIGIILGISTSWFLIAQKLREETEKYNALTIPEYLHRRFNDPSNVIRLFSAIIIAFFFMFYVSAQFHASGKVLSSLFDLSPVNGITIGATGDHYLHSHGWIFCRGMDRPSAGHSHDWNAGYSSNRRLYRAAGIRHIPIGQP